MDLLDRLYRNQILVHLVMDDDDRLWLRRISSDICAAIANYGLTGARATRMHHRVLCLLEVYLADSFDDLVAWMPDGKWSMHASIDPGLYRKVYQYRQNLVAALLVAFADTGNDLGDGEAALTLALSLLDGYRSAPATVRHRLLERSMAIDFPDAPLDIFAWLAASGIVPAAKFSTTSAEVAPTVEVTLRAGSLCEFEMFRFFARGMMHLDDASYEAPLADVVLRTVSRHISARARNRLVHVMQAEERRHRTAELKNSFAVLLDHRWHEKEYLIHFLTLANAMAPYTRAALDKQSTALTDIGAAMMAVRKVRTVPLKALYAVSEQTSIADDVAAALKSRGFVVHARTVYRRLGVGFAEHLEHLGGYFRLLQRSGVVFPVEHGDIFHYYQVGVTL